MITMERNVFGTHRSKIMYFMWIILPTILNYYNLQVNADSSCSAKDFGDSSVVCVCNATHCDTLDAIRKVPSKQYLVFTTSKDGRRFHKRQLAMTLELKRPVEDSEDYYSSYTIYHNETFQTLLGFGGAVTDAAAININSLTVKTRKNLISSYFSATGIEYNVIRTPIGGADFSERPYTYDDDHVDDLDLDFFALAPEDIKLKIPLLQEILRISSRSMALFGSAWSAPAWMKTDESITGIGTLKGQPGGPYYSTWAKYLVRFLDEYAKFNISFWGLTCENEPTNGLPSNGITTYNTSYINDLGFTAILQRDFIAKDLGPALVHSGHGDIKLMILDDQRLMLPQWAQTVLTTTTNGPPTAANQYVSGIAFHWYLNFAVPVEVLTATHEQFPDKFLLSTEACEGSLPWEKHMVILGSWERAENYAADIIEDLTHWSVGWVDWNIALSMKGGPNWRNLVVDSPIIVDAQNDQFYKQPMFYALGHFSKFLDPGSVRLNVTNSSSDSDVLIIAFEGPDSKTVFIVLNKSESPKNMAIRDLKGNIIKSEIPPQSIQTYIWWHTPGGHNLPNRKHFNNKRKL